MKRLSEENLAAPLASVKKIVSALSVSTLSRVDSGRVSLLSCFGLSKMRCGPSEENPLRGLRFLAPSRSDDVMPHDRHRTKSSAVQGSFVCQVGLEEEMKDWFPRSLLLAGSHSLA